MQFPNLIGQIAFAQPSDRSRPLDAYIVTGQGNDRAGSDTYLEIVSTRGGLLSSQVELVPLSDSKGGWTVVGHQDGTLTIRQIIDELTAALQNSSLTLTEKAGRETTNVRGYIVEALAHRCRQLAREDREAQDAGIAAERAAEDRDFESRVEALAADPNPQPKAETTDARIVIAIAAQTPEMVEVVRNHLRAKLES